MRHPSPKLSLLVILLYLTACTKSPVSITNSNAQSGAASNDNGQNGNANNANNQAAPADAWNLISDSTFQGVGLGNHPANYTGVPGDYFRFSTNGYVYTKEGDVLNTLAYQQFSDSSIIISDFGLIINGVPDTCTITGLTSSLTGNVDSTQPPVTIVIESPFFLTPGGEFWRKVTLTR